MFKSLVRLIDGRHAAESCDALLQVYIVKGRLVSCSPLANACLSSKSGMKEMASLPRCFRIMRSREVEGLGATDRELLPFWIERLGYSDETEDVLRGRTLSLTFQDDITRGAKERLGDDPRVREVVEVMLRLEIRKGLGVGLEPFASVEAVK